MLNIHDNHMQIQQQQEQLQLQEQLDLSAREALNLMETQRQIDAEDRRLAAQGKRNVTDTINEVARLLNL